MKMVQMLALGALVLTISVVAHAQEMVMQADAAGNVRMVEEESWRPLTLEEQGAVANPGVPVPVGTPVTTLQRVDFFHGQTITTYNQAVMFQDGRLQTRDQEMVRVGEVQVLAYVVLLLVAIGLMVVSSVLDWRGQDATAAAAFAAFAAAAAFAAFAAVAAAVAAAAAVSDNEPRVYKVAAAVFYIAAIATLFL